MTSIAEKMQKAGVDTIGAQLTAACIEGLHRHPDSLIEAWHYAGSVFGHEFVRGLMKDMRGNAAPPEPAPLPPLKTITATELMARPYKPKVISADRLQKRRELQCVVRSKFKTSGDVAWSDVGWHELMGLKRDGAEARALLEAGPASVPNDGRTVGEVLGVKRTDEIIGQIRNGGQS